MAAGRWRFELDPGRLEELARAVGARVGDLRERAEDGWEHAKHVRVRFERGGRRVGPEIPLPLLLIGEGAAVAALGPLATALANLGARVLLDVDFVHEAEDRLAEATAARGRGDLDAAEAALRAAVALRPEDPAALVALGMLLCDTGRADEGRGLLHRASSGPPEHPDTARASEALARG
jgi:cytochrome c-type biogenesis protein CcmH/NrfG